MTQWFKYFPSLCALLFTLCGALSAQVPSGYYNATDGKTGDALKVALHDIVKGHTTVPYTNLWDAFWSTDNKGNGIVWDMYSDIPNGTPPYTFEMGQNQCGSYQEEGDCYNREHSWPQSWFNQQTTPRSDLHQIFPTDGYVNQKRDAYPFGEVQSASWTSQNGSKLGACKSSLGYSGTVFEPIDAYKGDFARAIMYMSVRYYGEDSNWGTSGMTDKSEILPWAIAMLMDWNEQDPVSQKEIDRNNVIYADYQHNRNPFIDHPEYARMIWDEDWQGGGGGDDTGEGDYVKVTSAPSDWSGEYLIVCEAQNVAFNGTVESNWGRCSTVNINNATIESDATTDSYKVTISGSNSGYTFLFPDGKYMNWTAEKKFSEGTTAVVYSISFSDGSVDISYGDCHLQYNHNNGSGGLRSYKSNQTSIQLYKKAESQPTTQTINLAQGWTWWSTYLDITLEDLEAALGEHNASITSQNDGFIGNYSGIWVGNLQDISPSKMYKIQLGEDVSITLSGTPIYPTDHPITLKQGVNWIGYPLSRSMSLNEAFANASPVDGDIVYAYNTSAMYYNGTWFGNLQTLEPGHGYIYTSKASSDKTLAFPTDVQKK